MPVVVDEQDGERAVRKKCFAMLATMADDGTGYVVESVRRYHIPQFSGQRDATDIDITRGFMQHLLDERLVHRGLTAMGVEMARSQFDGLAQHHAQGDLLEAEFVSHLQCLTNIVAIFHKSLSWQV